MKFSTNGSAHSGGPVPETHRKEGSEQVERRLDVIELRRWCGAIEVPFLPLLEEFEMRLMAKPARRNSRNRRT